MLARDQPPRLPAAPLRGLAGLLAFFVLALACAAQSPVAHAWLHGDAHDECMAHAVPETPGEAGCPVTLFAQGLTVPFAAPELQGPRLLSEAALPAAPATTVAAAPDRLHPPAHAPPASG